MVSIKTEWNEQNLNEYVRYKIFLRNKSTKTVLISFAVFCALVFAFCLIVFFTLGYTFALVFALVMVLLAVFYTVFFTFSIKSAVKKILKSNAESELNRVMISEDDIIAFNDDEPIGSISWSKIVDIYFSEKVQAVYLTSEGNAVLILECKNILSGTSGELKEIVGAKRNELSKKA